MAKVQLKERQFEPTGKNLGEFEAVDLESFDLQYTDTDMEDEEQQQGANASSKPSGVPDPVDDNPLKDSKNQSGAGGGSSSSGSQGGQQDTQDEDDTPDDSDIQDQPDEIDPYGEDLDDQDPDLPDPVDMSDDDDMSYGGGGSDEDDTPSQVPNSASGGGDDSDGEQGDSQDGAGGDNGNDSSDGDSQGNQSGDNQQGNSSSGGQQQQDDSQGNNSSQSGGEDSSNSSGSSNTNEPNSGDNGGSSLNNSPDSDTSADGQRNNGSSEAKERKLEDLLKDYDDEDSSNGGGSSTDKASDTDNTNKTKGSNPTSGNDDQPNGQQGSQQKVPSEEELEEEDEDFNEGQGGMSDLESALNDIQDSTPDSFKEKEESDLRTSEAEDTMDSRSQKEREDEIQAAKDIVGKAAKDMKADQEDNPDYDDNDDYSNPGEESQDDILKDLGVGNLTTLFNPGNLKDWRSRLDAILDKALGFDIITNPNLINKKIEDAPPGREDELPQIKNIAVLLDMSGSMGAKEFKQVISHIDTMLRARKMNNTWFHIIGFGTSRISEIDAYYDRVKGSRFKKMMMTKYKNDAGWMTDILPGILFCAHKVHKPDAIIILTDAEFNGSLSEFQNNAKAKNFMRKNKNKIVWALTADARMSGVKDYDPTAIAKKRFIKFKKGGGTEDW